MASLGDATAESPPETAGVGADDDVVVVPVPQPAVAVGGGGDDRSDAEALQGATPEEASVVSVFLCPINTWFAANLIETIKGAAGTAGAEPRSYAFVGTPAKGKDTFPHGETEEVELSPDVAIVSPNRNADAYTAALTAADWVVCCVTDHDDSEDQVAAATAVFTDLKQAAGTGRAADAPPARFVLVSTFMTWARTLPADAEALDLPTTADEFLFRVPHPLFSAHHALETLVAREHGALPFLQPAIVTAGLLYGAGEGLLEFMFRAAWLPFESGVPLIGDGTNHVPGIHVRDCCSLVLGVLQQPETPALCSIAVDRSSHDVTMADVAQAIADGFHKPFGSSLGNDEAAPLSGAGAGANTASLESGGTVVRLGVADAYLHDDLTEYDIAVLTSAGPLFEAALHAPFARFAWVSPSGIVANMIRRVEEYIAARNLEPLRICVLGPPRSGKTTVAMDLVTRFGLMYVDPAAALEYARAESAHAATCAKEHAAALHTDASADPVAVQDADKTAERLAAEHNELAAIKTVADADAALVQRSVSTMLGCKMCRLQGYVLDGYPDTRKHVEAFGWIGGGHADEGRGGGGNRPSATPSKLVVADAKTPIPKMSASGGAAASGASSASGGVPDEGPERLIVLECTLDVALTRVDSDEPGAEDALRQRWATYHGAGSKKGHHHIKPSSGGGDKSGGSAAVFDPASIFPPDSLPISRFNVCSDDIVGALDPVGHLCDAVADVVGFPSYTPDGKVLTSVTELHDVFYAPEHLGTFASAAMSGIHWKRAALRDRRTQRRKKKKKTKPDDVSGTDDAPGAPRLSRHPCVSHHQHDPDHPVLTRPRRLHRHLAPSKAQQLLRNTLKREKQAAPASTSDTQRHFEDGQVVDSTDPVGLAMLHELISATTPAREWLHEKVALALGQTLLEVAKERPADPIAYIAEKLHQQQNAVGAPPASVAER